PTQNNTGISPTNQTPFSIIQTQLVAAQVFTSRTKLLRDCTSILPTSPTKLHWIISMAPATGAVHMATGITGECLPTGLATQMVRRLPGKLYLIESTTKKSTQKLMQVS